MKANSTPNYSWIDIIEPELQSTRYSDNDYIIALALIAAVLWMTVKYFNIPTKLKFLFITYNLKKTNFSRIYIKKILQLFYFEKGTGNVTNKEKDTDKEIMNTQRHILLNAYYSKDDINPEQIKKSLRILWKWL